MSDSSTAALPFKPRPRAGASSESAALAEELRAVLHRLSRQLRRESTQHGTSPLQMLMLALICDHPGIGVGELARMEKLRGPTVSGHVKALEVAGLVTRSEPDPEDRRRIGLHPSEQGRAEVLALRRRRVDWLAKALDALSAEARAAIRQALDPLGRIGVQS
jgi:DNA-binding MarR family transcriptional regulator